MTQCAANYFSLVVRRLFFLVVAKQNLITAKKTRGYYLEGFWKQRALGGQVEHPALLNED